MQVHNMVHFFQKSPQAIASSASEDAKTGARQKACGAGFLWRDGKNWSNLKSATPYFCHFLQHFCFLG